MEKGEQHFIVLILLCQLTCKKNQTCIRRWKRLPLSGNFFFSLFVFCCTLSAHGFLAARYVPASTEKTSTTVG